MDIKPPRKSVKKNASPAVRSPEVANIPRESSVSNQQVVDSGSEARATIEKSKSPHKSKAIKFLVGSLIAFLLAIGLGVAVFLYLLTPINTADNAKRSFVVKKGTGAQLIATQLKNKGLIRSDTAFYWYSRMIGHSDDFQAGSFMISPSSSSQEIAKLLTQGRAETFSITFYPGATLKDTYSKESKRTDVTTVLLRAGYSTEQIDQALSKKYEHPVLATKPDSASLEGYIYGDTYEFAKDTTAEAIIRRTLDELYKVVQSENLIEKFSQKKLSLYEGITLASIVQREVSNVSDMKQVAQVFHSRLDNNIVLGSDVTFIYPARQAGIVPRVDLDSPYNTRINRGLPPGPIASPGKQALIATANPAKGDYFYFVAGDDGKTYFSRTEAEHNRNAAQYCIKLCQEF